MLEGILTPELQGAVDQMEPRRRQALVELRLRCGSSVGAVFPWGEEPLLRNGRSIPVTDRLLKELLDRATGFSPYALRLEETGLYLPLEGGARMGLCGEAAVRDGRLMGLKKVSSQVIRLARQCLGTAEGTAKRLTARGFVESALILSPPGHGKTTFLRDLIRAVSERGYRVSVADERRELAAARNGVPQMDLGPCTDVLTGCPKGQALPLLLRVMNPQVLAVDELSGPEELHTAREAAGCGVALFATAHAEGLETLRRRPGFGDLLASGAFSWCVTLRNYQVIRMERLDACVENSGGVSGDGGVTDGRHGGPSGDAAAAESLPSAPAGAGADAGRDGAQHAEPASAV